MANYRQFSDRAELIQYLVSNNCIAYQAPLDVGVGTLHIRRVVIDHEKRSKTHAVVWTPQNGTLKLGVDDHFERFRVQIPRGEQA